VTVVVVDSSKINGPRQFKYELFSCFQNCYVCIFATFVPCYVEGKVAEKVGESCFAYGAFMFVPILNIVTRVMIRGMVRQQKSIAGDSCNDCCMSCFCGCCSLIQEARELNALDDGGSGETAVQPQAMSRQ